jgi:tetratricopeptide (TPR) repeat protein
MVLTGQNAGSPTGCNVPGTLAQGLMSAYHDFLGGPNFLAKAQSALDTTRDFSTAALNDAVQTIASQVQNQAQQYLTQTILIEPNKLGIALSPTYAPTSTGAITGKIHWKGTGASNCGPLPIEGRVQTGPQPINPITLQFSGTPPFATVGKNASAGASTHGADGSYECSYAETNLPAGVPVSFAPVNACGSAPQGLAHGVSIKPLGWSGTASPTSAGLDFEADALTCGSSVGALGKSAMAFNLALLPHGPDSMLGTGESAYARGDYAAAAKAFGQAFSANPKSYVALHNLALANAKLGNTSQAKSQLSQALSLAQAAHDAAAAKAIGASIGSLGG